MLPLRSEDTSAAARTDGRGTAPTATELRAQSRLCREAAAKESSPAIKRRLAMRALALAELAEKIEREQRGKIEPDPAAQ